MSGPTLGDGSVKLRQPVEADLQAYVRAFRDDPELANLLGYEEGSFENHARYSIDASWVDPPELNGWEFAIADDATDAFLGAIMFHSCHWRHRRAEVGFWIVPGARGRGVLSAALTLVLDWGFGELGLERVEMSALPENAIVPHIADKFGYVLEGTMRKRNFERGRRVDLLCWGLLKDERRGSTAR
jgi:[ribosomal protein S5]-alanine N-acetyltransferase